MNSYELRARTSVSGEGGRKSFADTKLPMTDTKGALDVEEGEVHPTYDAQGPVEFEEKKDLK